MHCTVLPLPSPPLPPAKKTLAFLYLYFYYNFRTRSQILTDLDNSFTFATIHAEIIYPPSHFDDVIELLLNLE